MSVPNSYIRQKVSLVSAGSSEPGWFAWVLDNHWDGEAKERTTLGELVYRAKYKNCVPSRATLADACRHAIRQINSFSVDRGGIREISAVVAAPSSSETSFGGLPLPLAMCAAISDELNVADLSLHVQLKAGLGAAKFGAKRDPEDFVITDLPEGLGILIVDDLISTGRTMAALGTGLRRKGATNLCGFCLTKVTKGMAN